MTTSPFQVPSLRINQLAPLTRSICAAISRLVTEDRHDTRTRKRHQSREPSTRQAFTLHVMCYGSVSSLRGYVLDDRAAVERLAPAWWALLERAVSPQPVQTP